MQLGGKQLSQSATHHEWCAKLRNQCKGPVSVASNVVEDVLQSHSSALGRSWHSKGRDPLDTDVSEPDMRCVIAEWNGPAQYRLILSQGRLTNLLTTCGFWWCGPWLG